MSIPDPNEIWPKLEKTGLAQVKIKLAQGVYAKYKTSIIEQWVQKKEQELSTRTWMYHEFEAPTGKIFTASEKDKLEKNGWVDTPDKFGQGIKAKSKRTLIIIKIFYKEHWKWIFGTMLAFGGLVFVALTYWHTLQADEGLIVQGGGVVKYRVINENSCVYAISFPIEFHNSGNKAVTLEQLTPIDDVEFILFQQNQNIVRSKDILHKVYLSNEGIGVIPSLWLKQINSQPQFKPSYSHISDLIYPDDSYRFNIIILIDPYKQFSGYKQSVAYIAFIAVFSNGQSLPVKSSVIIDTYSNKKCS